MTQTILRPNAAPLYAFLSFMQARLPERERLAGRSILDCGAGGVVPPLALFYAHGLVAQGIDLSEETLGRAQEFCDAHEMPLDLRQGDMREIPFEDGAFDYVYEHYSMCHLSKADTAKTVSEMRRVLKPGGLCFLGVISDDSWPKAIFGEERAPGEFWVEEAGKLTRHSLFGDDEAEKLVSDWEILRQEKVVLYLRGRAEEMSPEAWMELYDERPADWPRDAWQTRYVRRAGMFQYAHLYYMLAKEG